MFFTHRFFLTNFLILFAFLANTSVFSETAISKLADSSQVLNAPLVQEKIEHIEKDIFIISNKQNTLNPGDFITLIKDEKKIARALVAKTTDEARSGIKILKIYSLSLWNQLNNGMDILILKGDDSSFGKKNSNQDSISADKIESEEDLYSSDNIKNDDGSDFENKSKRNIKTDNIVSLGFGLFKADHLTAQGDIESAQSFYYCAGWAYQFIDNMWGEFLYGRSTLTNHPSDGIDTTLNVYTIRLKYAFSAPLYSYVLPYVGFSIRKATNSDAGVQTGGIPASQLNQEISLVDDLQKQDIAVGITVLKRLVPGWFAKLDLGTDIINLGVAFEF